MPNGILVSIDGKTLYVAESNSDDPSIDRELRAYPINDDGSLGPYAMLHAFGTDGTQLPSAALMECVSTARATSSPPPAGPSSGPGPLIYVFDPKGRVIETHPVPCIRPTNCCLRRP